jgi:hypothetical protein
MLLVKGLRKKKQQHDMQLKDDRRRSAHRVAFFRRVSISEGDVELGHTCDMESANQIARKKNPITNSIF